MHLAALLDSPPMLHADAQGNLTTWKATDVLLRFLDEVTHEGARTLETGAGLSTLVFTMCGAHHTAVVPDPAQAARIREWCAAQGISTEHLTFELEPSEDVLPRHGREEALDVVLIDGAHGFPAPFIDWYYAARRLRVGGTLIVDDTQIWTGKVLRDFLCAEPQWELIRDVPLDFAAFRRVADGRVGEWNEQPYVLSRSYGPQSTSSVRRLVSRGRGFAHRLGLVGRR